MNESASLTLVVPCYNEALRLDREAFVQALTTMGWLNLCFVDDGSTDGTGALLREMQAVHPSRIEVVTLSQNSGKAEAVRQGLLRAMARSPEVGFWDADLAAPLDEVLPLREVLAQTPSAEWVWGIRLRALGRVVERRALRHYLGRLFATAASLLLDVPSYDTQCGAKLFRSGPLLREVLSEPFRSRWIFDVELLTRALALREGSGQPAGATALVYEQPLTVWTHRAGSKVRPTDFLRALRELLVVRRARARWRRSVP